MTLANVIERSKADKAGWRYTNLAPLAAKHFAPVPPDALVAKVFLPSVVGNESERHRIVFVDGILRRELSRLGELEGLLKENAGGASLKIEGQTCLITAPVELVFLGSAPAEINTNFSVTLGANTRLTLVEHIENAAASVHVRETAIRLGAQSKLVHGKIIDGGGAMLARTRVDVAAGAYYDNFNLVMGGEVVRDEIDVALSGPLAQCAVNGAMLLRGARHADTTAHIVHAAPHTSSRQFYKSVLDQKARGVFQGKITVAAGAQKADGQQLSRALLLSDQAEMDALPELKIYADDVKCSHGSTVGELDAEPLFYLQARGIDEREARSLLIRGFLDEVLDEIRAPEWRAYAQKKAGEWLDAGGAR